MTMMVTCKFCKYRGKDYEFRDGCPTEGCVVGRRRGRKGNNPPAILIGNKHHHNCLCDRCIDSDPNVSKLERQLEQAWEKHNREQGIMMPNIRLTTKESPVVGPYMGKDVDEARFVTCPMAIVFYIQPKGRRRK